MLDKLNKGFQQLTPCTNSLLSVKQEKVAALLLSQQVVKNTPLEKTE